MLHPVNPGLVRSFVSFLVNFSILKLALRAGHLSSPARQLVRMHVHLSLFHQILLLGNMVLSSSFILHAILFCPRQPPYLSPRRRETCGMNVTQIILVPLGVPRVVFHSQKHGPLARSNEEVNLIFVCLFLKESENLPCLTQRNVLSL